MYLLFPIQSFAYPYVGDQAEYKGFMKIMGRPVLFNQINKLAEYNANTNQFKKIVITIQEGKTEAEVSWVKYEDLVNESGIEYLLMIFPPKNGQCFYEANANFSYSAGDK